MIIISAAAVIVIAGLVVVGLLVFGKKSDTTTKDTKPVLVADTSKDFGACTLLTKEKLKSALGSPASKLQGPDNMGLGRVSGNASSNVKGDQSQRCIYSFVSGGTIDNAFNADNGFAVEVYVHKDQASVTAYQAIKNPIAVEVTGIGDAAEYLSSNTADEKLIRSTLVVFVGLRHYSFTISQPADAATFTSETAKAALETIANAAKLN